MRSAKSTLLTTKPKNAGELETIWPDFFQASVLLMDDLAKVVPSTHPALKELKKLAETVGVVKATNLHIVSRLKKMSRAVIDVTLAASCGGLILSDSLRSSLVTMNISARGIGYEVARYADE